jgi:hypothetical protein
MMEVNKWPTAFLRKSVQKKLQVKEHNLSYEARKATFVGHPRDTDIGPRGQTELEASTAFAETILQYKSK